MHIYHVIWRWSIFRIWYLLYIKVKRYIWTHRQDLHFSNKKRSWNLNVNLNNKCFCCDVTCYSAIFVSFLISAVRWLLAPKINWKQICEFVQKAIITFLVTNILLCVSFTTSQSAAKQHHVFLLFILNSMWRTSYKKTASW